MSGRPVAAAVSSQRVSGVYAVEVPRERYVAEAPVGLKKRLSCTVRSLAIVEDAEEMKPTVVDVGVKASAPESWRVSFPLVRFPEKAPVKPERMPPKVAVPSTAKVEEAPKEPVTSKVEPKVEDAAETNPWSKNQELAVEEAER